MLKGNLIMQELNFELLQENIRKIIIKKSLTQSTLAEIAGMTQSNVSKALNAKETKEFTLEQVYRIAQYFGVSIDDLVGNKAADNAPTSPRGCLEFITRLLCSGVMRSTVVTVEECVYEKYYNSQGFPDCNPEKRSIEYPAFYFADYHRISDFAKNESDAEDVHFEFLSGGNDTKFQQINEIFRKIIPMINLYRETEIPDEAFQMILDGYLEQLPEK